MAYRWQDCYCRECESMDLKDVWKHDNSKRYCSERREYYNPNDKACSRMKYDEQRKTTSTSRCYLTTMISTILNFPDNGEALNTLRKFRDEYMLNHPETYVMLIEYDIVGPKIAEALRDDAINVFVAKTYYENYIKPIVTHISIGEYWVAIEKYKEMVFRLKNMYHIDDTITKRLDINIKTLGKAHA